MATQTPNLNLVLPDYADKADIGVVNDNFKKIDDFSGGGKVEEWLDSIQKKADESLAKIDQDVTSYLNNIQKEANESLQEIQTEATTSLNEIENKAKNSLESIPDDYEVLAGDVSSLKDQKANVIIDTSARAASHELHAQDGDMSVTLYGKTTETGTGDKSPDNPYVISGVAGAHVSAGGKNLISGWIVGETINNSSGAFMTSIYGDKAARTDYMPISPGKRYTLSNMPTDMFNFVALYDGNKNFVRRTNATALANRIVSPDDTRGCYYAAIAQYWNKDISTDASTPSVTTAQFELGGTATPYEPYNANVITPALLPSGAPLMGNGTVDDTVENDVLSGCDKKIVLNGGEAWSVLSMSIPTPGCTAFQCNDVIASIPFAETSPAGNDRFSWNYTGGGSVGPSESWWYNYAGTGIRFITSKATTVDEWKTYLAANPLTVYYRSTEYAPDKDLRVCKTVRRLKTATLDKNSAGGLGTTSDGKPRISYPKFKDWTAYNNYLSALDIGFCASEIAVIARTADGGTLVTNFNQASFGIIFPEGTTHDQAKEAIDGTKFVYQLATPEIYMTDPLPLHKPTGMMPVTVTGSGETAVEYPHDTKHYIDQKFDALAAALLNV